MIEALGSPGAFFVPKMPLFRGKNRFKLPNYYSVKWQIFLEIRVASSLRLQMQPNQNRSGTEFSAED